MISVCIHFVSKRQKRATSTIFPIEFNLLIQLCLLILLIIWKVFLHSHRFLVNTLLQHILVYAMNS
jgi:hypothetical protein